jgi:hypothetical protein
VDLAVEIRVASVHDPPPVRRDAIPDLRPVDVGHHPRLDLHRQRAGDGQSDAPTVGEGVLDVVVAGFGVVVGRCEQARIPRIRRDAELEVAPERMCERQISTGEVDADREAGDTHLVVLLDRRIQHGHPLEGMCV